MMKLLFFGFICIYSITQTLSAEVGQIEEGVNDSLLKDTLLMEKTDTDSINEHKAAIISSVEGICKQLNEIKKNVDIVSVSLITISTTLKIQNEKKYKEITDFLDRLAIYGSTVSKDIPKMVVEVKKIKTKIKIAKTVDDLLGVNDDIIACMDKLNEYAKAFDLDQEFVQNYLGTETAPLVELLKKYFTSCIGMLEKLPDQLDKYIETLTK
ncbi:MAG: hypothetical protein ABIL02_03385 [candidate division WOR-3 bacterium]